jgi:hypothetical protein
MKRLDPPTTDRDRSARMRKMFIRALRKARSEYDAEKTSPGFSRDPARTDTAESNEDAGSRERRNEDRYEDREEATQERDVVATEPVLAPRLQQMVDAVRSAAPNLSEQEVVHFLLHTARGRDVAEHLSNHITKSRKAPPMSRIEIVKRYGLATIAKGMLMDSDAYDITEHEFTAMMLAEATRKGLSFEKYFTAPENIDIRKAHQLTKATLMVPVEVQPVSVETRRTDTESDAKAAYDQLMEMAEELAASGEYRSVASAFSALFEDQKNAELAARAHRRPNAAYA